MTAQPLCASRRCRHIGRHTTNCSDNACRGCQPRQAADGLRLCLTHATRIGHDAAQAAALYDELALALMPAGASGEPGRGGSDGPAVPRDRVVAVRTEIRNVLVSWCRLIADERGHQLPADSVTAMGAYLTKHSTWLAAHAAAGDASDEFDSLRRRAWGAAYPSGAHIVHVGPCPQPGCAGTLQATIRPADQLLPSEVACDTNDQHRWDSTQWRQLDRLVTGRMAA
jgi:hypothetical protein